jgi:MFS family permease
MAIDMDKLLPLLAGIGTSARPGVYRDAAGMRHDPAMRDQAIGQPTWPAALGAAVLYGMGYGAYIAVDQALITQVLPQARDRAKDLGIINIAIVCPGAIGALIAAPVVSLAGYPALFAATAVVAIAASLGVWRIKSVR